MKLNRATDVPANVAAFIASTECFVSTILPIAIMIFIDSDDKIKGNENFKTSFVLYLLIY